MSILGLPPQRTTGKKKPRQFGELFEFLGWKTLEEDNRLTKSLQKLRDVGFAPPTNAFRYKTGDGEELGVSRGEFLPEQKLEKAPKPSLLESLSLRLFPPTLREKEPSYLDPTLTVPEIVYKRAQVRWEERREKEVSKKWFESKYPERYKEIEKLDPFLAVPGAKEYFKKEGIMSEEELDIFERPEIVPPIMGTHFVSPQQANKMITQSIKSQLTRQDIIDITAERIKSGPKYTAYKTMAGDPVMKKELLAIARNKKVGLNQKIGTYLRGIYTDYFAGAPKSLQIELPEMPKTKVGITIGKARAIVPKGAKKLILEGQKPATSFQIKKAHTLASKLKLITKTESGAVSKLRYNRLIKKFSGKSSMKDMTEKEADEWIDAIKSVSKRQPWEPPIIPMTGKVVPQEFFDIAFKEPGLAKYFTPKEYYQRALGTDKLLKPLTDAYKKSHLEQQNINRWVDDVVRRINKQGKVSRKEKIIAKTLNKPTKPVAKMRDLLDEYEWAPEFLPKEEAKIFNEVRSFTKDILKRTNEVRARLGLAPITEIKTYITHYLDELSRQIVNKKYPFPEDVKYWTGKSIPGEVKNPTAMQRSVRKDLDVTFSKDLGKVLKAMSRYDLRDIYLSEPYSILRAELSALGDRIPATTRNEINDYLKYDIFRHPDELDQILNKSLELPTSYLNNYLKPLNRVISNPIKSISNITRRAIMSGVIWGRPKLAIRNIITQKLLTTNLYPLRHYARAQFWKTDKSIMKDIRNTDFYKLSRRFEDIPEGIMKVESLGMLPYQKSHTGINYFSNVDTAMKVGYYYGDEMMKLSSDTNSKFYKYAVDYSKKHDVPLKDLLWTKADKLAEAEEAGSVTQWLYFSTDMPRVYRGHTKRMAMTLQSWWQNFFFKHYRECITRTVRGRTSRGKLIRPSDRINWLKGTVVILGVTEALRRATGLDYQRFLFLAGPAPTLLSPPAQVVLGMYKLMTANTEYQRMEAERQIKYSYKAFIPGSMAWRDMMEYLHGEKTMKEYLFYTEKRGKEKAKKGLLGPPPKKKK
ncbi:MAG: hypothetical protein ACTSQE_06880 [Candidatus Heimdallarchaeaceae archaeon]